MTPNLTAPSSCLLSTPLRPPRVVVEITDATVHATIPTGGIHGAMGRLLPVLYINVRGLRIIAPLTVSILFGRCCCCSCSRPCGVFRFGEA